MDTRRNCGIDDTWLVYKEFVGVRIEALRLRIRPVVCSTAVSVAF